MLAKLRAARYRHRLASAASAFTLAVSGLIGVTAAPAHAATAMDLAYVVDSVPSVFSPVPVVTGISPSAGSRLGGDTVTITGMRFAGTFRVMFGGVAVPYTLNSDSQITVVAPPWSSLMAPAAGTTPAGSVALVDVQVTTDVDTSATGPADVFDYVAPATTPDTP